MHIYICIYIYCIYYVASGADFSRDSYVACTMGESQDFWSVAEEPFGRGSL